LAFTNIEFEWDDDKDRINQIKHGVSFNTGASIFNDATIDSVDDREDYGEVRYIALGQVESVVMKVVYTIRGEGRYRIISVQRANKHEQSNYYRSPFFE